MSNAVIHVGDIGTEFQATIKDETGAVVPLGGATVKKFRIQRKTKTDTLFVEAEYTTDGADGKLSYFTVEGDLSVAGTYRIQAFVEMPSWSGHSDIVDVTVEGNIAEPAE